MLKSLEGLELQVHFLESEIYFVEFSLIGTHHTFLNSCSESDA